MKKSQFATQERNWHVFCDNCKKQVPAKECDLKITDTHHGETVVQGKHNSCGGVINTFLALR